MQCHARRSLRLLARSDAELRRMVRCSPHLEDHTLDFLRRAGIRAGMRVLAVGSPSRDLVPLAARLVGPGGTVVAPARSPGAMGSHSVGAAVDGPARLALAVPDIDALARGGPFDAVIGRFALLYQPDPGATLQALARRVRPGGVVALQELDWGAGRSAAGAPLYERCREWMRAAFAELDLDLELGSRLPEAFRRARLPAPPMLVVDVVAGGSRSPAFRYVAESVRSLLPTLEHLGIATAAEVDAETLEARLRAEARAGDHCPALPAVVAAWTRKGED